ncbi:hypothetical protein KSP40_PGU011541 [Platanthera guangdongensis]|uniref:RNase H type-1 domain-containing protein n=1 Tax=Platanthera guangdongensis TaxID=2320717 RepID=A0ABR2LCX0_9ASPA
MRIPLGWTWEEVVRTGMHGGEAAITPVRLLCYVMYQCWRAWNAKLLHREVGTPVVIATTIMENLSLFDQGRTPGCWSTSHPSGHFRSSTWCPPPPRWIKVNVDGSPLSSRCAGLGIVVRSEGGQVLMAVGFAWQHWDPGRVELEAILAIRRVVLPTLLAARGIILLKGLRPMIWTSAARRLGALLAPTPSRGMWTLHSLRSLRRCGSDI